MPGTLSLNSVTTMSLLFGAMDSASTNVLNGATNLNVSEDSTRRLVAALHMRSGVAYNFPIGSFTGIIKAGYEYNSYIGAVTLGQSIPTTSRTASPSASVTILT